MTALNDADRNEGYSNEGYSAELPSPDPADSALEKVEQRLAELREQGIFADGHDPKGRPRTIAHVPGALERFMERRG